MKPTICLIDDQGRLTLPDALNHELRAQSFDTAVLSKAEESYRMVFLGAEVATAILHGQQSMDEFPEAFQALAGIPESSRPNATYEPHEPRLCPIDDRGRLILSDDVARELQGKGMRAAVLSGGPDGYRLEFFPDEIAAKALMIALIHMEEHPEVYRVLAKD